MYKLLAVALVVCGIVGCEDRSGQVEQDSTAVPHGSETTTAAIPSTEAAEFAERWKLASPEERQAMADLSKVGRLFLGASKERIQEVFGVADQAGIDDFGADVMRYELGTIPDMEGVKAHLTFEFKNDVVTNVMGNSISL